MLCSLCGSCVRDPKIGRGTGPRIPGPLGEKTRVAIRLTARFGIRDVLAARVAKSGYKMKVIAAPKGQI
jgi:hypothetical protein